MFFCQQCCDCLRGPLDKTIHQERVNGFGITNTRKHCTQKERKLYAYRLWGKKAVSS